jgi:hypothetical protein
VPNPLAQVGKSLIGLGLFLALAGGVLLGLARVPHLGRLPGDIAVERPGFRFYAPLGTSLLLSLLISLALALLRRK